MIWFSRRARAPCQVRGDLSNVMLTLTHNLTYIEELGKFPVGNIPLVNKKPNVPREAEDAVQVRNKDGLKPQPSY